MTEFNRYAITNGNVSKLDAILTLKDERNESRKGYIFVSAEGDAHAWSSELEFINGFEILSTKIDKLFFAIASFCGQAVMPDGTVIIIHETENTEKNIVQIESIMKKIKPNFKNFHFVDEDFAKYGLIKASTDGLLEKFLNTHNITLEDFVMDAKYEVIIDCGNNTFKQLKKLKLIDMNLVEEEYRG